MSADRPIRETDWVSAHLFYHGDLDLLLVELVAPLVDELATDDLCHESFFLRYWDGGPHVRLRLLAPPPSADHVRSRVTERCGEFFRRRLAPTTLDPEDYLRTAGELARREGVADYARRLYPNNSVAFVPYRRERGRYGHGASIQAVERHFVESSRIALSLVTAGLSSRQRDTAALSLLMLAWFCGELNPADLVPHLPGPMTLPDAEQRYQRQRTTVRMISARMRAIASQHANMTGDGVFAVWSRSVTRLRSALGSSPTASRIIDTCAHLVCNRLGVTVADEAYLRYLATSCLLADTR